MLENFLCIRDSDSVSENSTRQRLIKETVIEIKFLSSKSILYTRGEEVCRRL